MCVDGIHIKDQPRTYNCHIGVFAKAQFDILEFLHSRQNIVHNVQIFIKNIQADGPTFVLRRHALKHTPQVTNLNLNPFPFKISDSLKIMWREKEECQSVQTEKVIRD